MAYALRATEKVNIVTEDDELRKRGYSVGVTLGEGSYAKVKSALSEKMGKKVALKIINRRKAPKDFQQRFLPRELDILKTLNHPNVVAMYEIMHFNGKVYIAMEMAGHGDLLEYIKLRGAIPEEKSRGMFQQLVLAVDYLHTNDIVHRDLKCENILLDVNNNLKVSDFGFARFLGMDELSKTFCGSAAYAAPEILQGIPYHGAAYDIWSMGVVLYIMVCGSMPYDDSNIKKMIKYQTERKVGFSRHKNISDECKNLIHIMLEAVVKNRATIHVINAHPWLHIARPSSQQAVGASTLEANARDSRSRSPREPKPPASPRVTRHQNPQPQPQPQPQPPPVNAALPPIPPIQASTNGNNANGARRARGGSPGTVPHGQHRTMYGSALKRRSKDGGSPGPMDQG